MRPMTTPDTTTPVPAEPVTQIAAPETRSPLDATPEDFVRSTAAAFGVDPEQAVAALPPKSRNSADPVADPNAALDAWLHAEKVWKWLEAEKAAWKAWLDAERAAWRHPEGWEHQWLEDFHGDRLAIKIPTRGMVNAIQHAGTTSLAFQQRLVAKFESEHISEATRERVINRLTDPDDPDYTGDEWDELSTEILKTAAERMNKEDEALAEVKAPKSR